jgi:hypothetical protein
MKLTQLLRFASGRSARERVEDPTASFLSALQ